ncbi:hypothetical protein [Thiovibrio frasassiensis]|uniref:Uncharacterized protein n=1 Tax=Thiovibrio frasassiensis TaxID=2984131 RepID=A0A9X4MBQ2_9BACT|nr:hypothetical protein [Thiovibrio frasassiensis]MDG4474659.1 hypothetical protein [Thiovibrio frasassiensis]
MKYFLALLLLLLTVSAHAENITCSIDGMFMHTIIGWDTVSGKAKLSDFIDRSVEGNLVYSRKHDDGYAHNIIFHFNNKKTYGTDMAEFVIYPKNKKGKQQILGTAFIVKDGEKHVDYSYGMHDIQCQSL